MDSKVEIWRLLGTMGEYDIRFLVMDVDGTLTDGKLYIGNDGESFKAFDVKDGYGIKEMLPMLSIVPVIITARESNIVKNRCAELGITELHQGRREKLDCLMSVLASWSEADCKEYTLHNVAYIGDDMPDCYPMEKVREQGGLVACPADAAEGIKTIADYVCKRSGGNGAVREFIEYIQDMTSTCQ